MVSGLIRGETPSISQLNPPSARLFPDASGGAVKGVGAYTAEVRGSNPLSSTRKSASASCRHESLRWLTKL
jgi:hypothetical protein